MADEKLLKAQRVFKKLCETLDAREWHYDKDEEKLLIESGAQGEDLPIQLRIRVDAGRQLVYLVSPLSFTVEDDHRLDLAIAVSAINNMLVDGSFDYNVVKGRIAFRMTNSFWESEMGEDMFFYLVMCACQTVDDYNDQLLLIARGKLPVDQFISALKK